MAVTQMTCCACSLAIHADFPAAPLANLPVEQQRFIELFVLAGGSLKKLAAQADVSYPTVRSRLDKVIETLRKELASSCPAMDKPPDARPALTAPEHPALMTPAAAARIIKRI